VARAIDSESWLQKLRGEMGRDTGPTPPVAALYVRLQTATREELMREMGEGGNLEEFGARVDLDSDLSVNAIGATRTEQQARDLAARLGERIREVRGRPIVAAFGLGSVVDSVRFIAEDVRVHGNLRVSERERSEISQRMTIVAELLAKMRKEKPQGEENKQP
jgi:hypothetical protein